MSQQNPNPQPDARPGKGKSRRDRPFTLQMRFRKWRSRGNNAEVFDGWGDFADWHTCGRYRTAAERDAAKEQLERKTVRDKHGKPLWEYRVAPE